MDIALDLSDNDIKLIKALLKEYPNLKCYELLDILKDEEVRRKQIDLQGEEVIKKFLLKYVRFELCDGLGSYEVWKVKRIDVYENKTYSLYPDKGIVSNIDGTYSIDSYLEDVVIETTDDLKNFTVIPKEEYDKEFEKAIEYYKSFKTD